MNNTTITDDLLAEIEDAAGRATNGDWFIRADGIEAGDFEGSFRPFGGCGCCGSPWMGADDEARQQADADHIVLSRPDNVLAMIHHIRQLESTLQATADYLSKSAILPGSILHDRIKESLS